MEDEDAGSACEIRIAKDIVKKDKETLSTIRLCLEDEVFFNVSVEEATTRVVMVELPCKKNNCKNY
jgi:hypothetical protein